MKIFAVIKQPDEIWASAYIFNDWDEYHRETFSPECEIEIVRTTAISGGTYSERKANAEKLAIDLQNALIDATVSWWLEAELGEIFSRLGKRFGLLREFHENGIC